MAKEPRKTGFLIKTLIQLIVRLGLIGQKNRQKIDPRFKEINKHPYLMLCNHMQFLDFFIQFKVVKYRSMCNVVNLDAYQLLPYWLVELGGSIPKRKFLSEIVSVGSIKKAFKKGASVAMYPEARYSMYGEQSDLPESLGKLIKNLDVPVVTLINHGNHLVKPTWGNQKKRKLPVYAEVKVAITKDELAGLSVEEINKRLKEIFTYNEYQYLKDNYLEIKEIFRAEGLHKVLYKCPHCGTEFMMSSAGSFLKCNHCQTIYQMLPSGDLECQNQKTIFRTVHDWIEYQKTAVKKEIDQGTYYYQEEIDQTFAFPHPKHLIPIGKSTLIHDLNGFTAYGNYNNADYKWHKTPQENQSVQIEFSWPNYHKADTIALQTLEVGLYFIPKNPSVLTKIYFATEELYNRSRTIKQL